MAPTYHVMLLADMNSELFLLKTNEAYDVLNGSRLSDEANYWLSLLPHGDFNSTTISVHDSLLADCDARLDQEHDQDCYWAVITWY